jgi:hypothetical protein
MRVAAARPNADVRVEEMKQEGGSTALLFHLDLVVVSTHHLAASFSNSSLLGDASLFAF